MKNIVKVALLGVSLLSTLLMATSFEHTGPSKSLVGVEAGYSSVDYEFGTTLSNSQSRDTIPMGGLKIGAESKNYRVFLSGRYFYDSSRNYDYISAYGAEIQYKFNPTKVFDIFIGANAGIANLKWKNTSETFSRTISTTYFGGDLGANIHLGESVDWEIGARVMSLNDTNTINNATYRINTIVSGYTSIIFKWQMD